MDTKASDLEKTEGTLFLYTEEDGTQEPGILLNNVVPASMKSTEYESFGAFTSEKIIASKCSCACGGGAGVRACSPFLQNGDGLGSCHEHCGHPA